MHLLCKFSLNFDVKWFKCALKNTDINYCSNYRHPQVALEGRDQRMGSELTFQHFNDPIQIVMTALELLQGRCLTFLKGPN